MIKPMYLFIAAVIAMLVLSFCGCGRHRGRGRYFDSTAPHYLPKPGLALLLTGRPA